MKKYFSLLTGIVALGTEVLVFLSLMEMQPFGKGGSDIIWALPFFGLVVFALAAFGFLAALRARESLTPARNLSNCRGFAKRSQPPNSNCDARFSSWSSPCVGWPLNESLNRTLGLSRPYSEFSQRIDGLFHRQPDDVCE